MSLDHAEFISEVLRPSGTGFDAAAMARGEPGLPTEFVWRHAGYDVIEVLASWKQSESEGGRAGAERYLRRHYFRIRVTGGDVWTVYFTRQSSPGASAKSRWFLYSVEHDQDSCRDDNSDVPT